MRYVQLHGLGDAQEHRRLGIDGAVAALAALSGAQEMKQIPLDLPEPNAWSVMDDHTQTFGPLTVMAEAEAIIYGDREQTYGHPAKNFEHTAALWNAYMEMKGVKSVFSVDDVAMFMVLLKMARQFHKHKRDNLVDMIGYIGCVQKCIDYNRKGQ